MTETRGELIERGWQDGMVNWADVDIVSRMRCKHNGCGGKLYLEAWIKPGQYGKQFTECRKCGHRKEF